MRISKKPWARYFSTKHCGMYSRPFFRKKKCSQRCFKRFPADTGQHYEDIVGEFRPLEDLQRLELFVKGWISASINRAWESVRAAQLSEDDVFRLFKCTLAPFREDHPFSCVPNVLYESIGRPPADWCFIKAVVKGMFAEWGENDAARNRNK